MPERYIGESPFDQSEPPTDYTFGPNDLEGAYNCGGGCVRSGQAQWKLLLEKRPEVYAEWEAEEERSRTELGKDVAILRDRRGGTTKPMTLRDFRKRIEGDATLFDPNDWGACNCMDGADDDLEESA